MSAKVLCYFSFRSPYSCLAIFRLSRIINQLPVEFEFIHIFPPPGKKLSNELNPAKLAYIRRDIARIASAYGYPMCFPKPFDINWVVPHAAFLHAKDMGKSVECMNAMYTARFVNGSNLEHQDTLVAVAGKCNIDAEEFIRVSGDQDYHQRVMEELASIPDKMLFGVPTFVYGKNRYWGNDRLEWLLRDIYQDAGIQVPDLKEDPLARPF